MKNLYLFFAFAIGAASIHAQTQENYNGKVGINVEEPVATLDIKGDMNVRKVYLKNPSTDILSAEGGKYLATFEDTSDIGSVDIGKNALFHSITLKLNNVPYTGITGLNTGISSDNFVVVLHSYSIAVMGETDENTKYNVALYNKNSADHQGSPNFRTYMSGSTSCTWKVDANFKDSYLKKSGNSANPSTENNPKKFEVTLHLMAYKKLITKNNIADVTFNAANLSSTDKCNFAFNAPPGFSTNSVIIDGVSYNLSEGTCATK